MSFTGELIMADRWQKGSGPPATDVPGMSPKADMQTTEPISLAWKQSLLDQILDIASMCSHEGWDGEEASAISSEAARRAWDLISVAPDSIRPPEAVPSPDGQIAFEWHSGRQRIFTLMPHGEEEFIFAAILGPKNNRISGRKPIGTSLPDTVLNVLTEYFPNARAASTI